MPQLRLAEYPFETVLIAVALLLLLSVIGSRFSAMAGVPSLLVFLGIGMLAGSDGPGGIEFTNYVGIEYEGLYSVLLLAFVILLFATTSAVGGSGFLAAYVAGLRVGNSDLRQLFALRLPSAVLLSSIEREGRFIVPDGQTRFAAGDRVHAFARPSNMHTLRATFGAARATVAAG